jgi:hypothetical protein
MSPMTMYIQSYLPIKGNTPTDIRIMISDSLYNWGISTSGGRENPTPTINYQG